MKIEEVIIIGAGPSGIAAAIQLKRYGIDPLIFEKERIGGLLVNANLVENYPGFPEGIKGPVLVNHLSEHLATVDGRVYVEKVTELDHDGTRFIVRTEKKTYQSCYTIVASGTIPSSPHISIPGNCEARVFHEVYPIMESSGKRIIIIGAGDAAFDYALNVSSKNKVTILSRSNRVKCLSLLYQRVRDSHNISYLENTRVERIASKDAGLHVTIRRDAGLSMLDADYLVFAIGREPSLQFLSERLQKRMATLQEEGLLYLIGDVRNGIYRQASIAVGDGIKAAMQIARILPEKPE